MVLEAEPSSLALLPVLTLKLQVLCPEHIGNRSIHKEGVMHTGTKEDNNPLSLIRLPGNFVSWEKNWQKAKLPTLNISQLVAIPKFNYQNRGGSPGLNSTLWVETDTDWDAPFLP